jgi:hypothetical protein
MTLWRHLLLLAIAVAAAVGMVVGGEAASRPR